MLVKNRTFCAACKKHLYFASFHSKLPVKCPFFTFHIGMDESSVIYELFKPICLFIANWAPHSYIERFPIFCVYTFYHSDVTQTQYFVFLHLTQLVKNEEL